MSKENVVYKITSPSGKYYIGSTNNFSRRFKQHCNDYCKTHSSDYIKYAAAKYGAENLSINIIGSFDTRKGAYAKEQELLDQFYDDDLCMNTNRSACGYNTESAKAARASVENVFDIHAYMEAHPEKRGGRKGKTYSKESAKQRGAKYIEVISPEGQSLGKFEDIKSLKESFPQFKSSGNISSCARGKLKHYKKHTFKYVD